jgi:hypothetical protein
VKHVALFLSQFKLHEFDFEVEVDSADLYSDRDRLKHPLTHAIVIERTLSECGNRHRQMEIVEME